MSTRDLSRYQNAQIYSIRSHMTPEVYYGSSCKMLAKRLHEHRSNFKRYKKGTYKRYVSSYEILKYPDNYIELEAKVPCTCIEELRAIEGQYIRNNPCVNKNISDNKEKTNEKMTCDCGSVIFKRNYKRHLTSKKHKNWIKNN